jgi:hypothetical protein
MEAKRCYIATYNSKHWSYEMRVFEQKEDAIAFCQENDGWTWEKGLYFFNKIAE